MAAGVLFHVSGFGPFGGGEVTLNPTQVLVEALPAAVASGRFPLPAGAALASTAVLTTSARAAAAYVAALPLPRRGRSPPAGQPASAVCVLHLGVHSGAKRIRLERCAWNEATFRCADEAGWAPQGEAVVPADGDVARCRRSRLPVDALVARLAASGFPVEASDDPGRFVCNFTFYLTLAATQQAEEAAAQAEGAAGDDATHALSPADAAAEPPWHALFVHVPPTEVVPLELQTRFLAALMESIAAHLAPATPQPHSEPAEPC